MNTEADKSKHNGRTNTLHTMNPPNGEPKLITGEQRLNDESFTLNNSSINGNNILFNGERLQHEKSNFNSSLDAINLPSATPLSVMNKYDQHQRSGNLEIGSKKETR